MDESLVAQRTHMKWLEIFLWNDIFARVPSQTLRGWGAAARTCQNTSHVGVIWNSESARLGVGRATAARAPARNNQRAPHVGVIWNSGPARLGSVAQSLRGHPRKSQIFGIFQTSPKSLEDFYMLIFRPTSSLETPKTSSGDYLFTMHLFNVFAKT